MDGEGLDIGLGDLDLTSLIEKENSTEGTTLLNRNSGGIKKEEDLEEDTDETEEEDNDTDSTDTKGKEETASTTSTAEADDETDETDSSDEDVDTDSTESKDSPFKLIAQLFKEKGVIAEIPDDLEDSDEAISTLFSSEIKKRTKESIEDYKASLPEEIKHLVEHYEEGVNITDLLKREQEIADYSSISKTDLTDNESLQSELVKTKLIHQGLSEDKADKKVEKYKNSGILGDEAEESLEYILQVQEAEKQAGIKQDKDRQKAIVAQRDASLKDLEKTINDKTGAIPNLDWTKDDKRKLYKGLTEVVGKDKAGRPMNAVAKYMDENPDFKLVIADLILLREGKIEKIKTLGGKEKMKETKDLLDGKTKTTASKLKGVDLSVIKGFLRGK